MVALASQRWCNFFASKEVGDDSWMYWESFWVPAEDLGDGSTGVLLEPKHWASTALLGIPPSKLRGVDHILMNFDGCCRLRLIDIFPYIGKFGNNHPN